MNRTALRPSDAAVWCWQSDTRLRLVPLTPGRRLFDTTYRDWPSEPHRYNWPSVTITYEPRTRDEELFGHLDADSRRWCLTTCGPHKGATRHHPGMTLGEAQAHAFRWLDRRYRHPDTESEKSSESA